MIRVWFGLCRCFLLRVFGAASEICWVWFFVDCTCGGGCLMVRYIGCDGGFVRFYDILDGAYSLPDYVSIIGSLGTA